MTSRRWTTQYAVECDPKLLTCWRMPPLREQVKIIVHSGLVVVPPPEAFGITIEARRSLTLRGGALERFLLQQEESGEPHAGFRILLALGRPRRVEDQAADWHARMFALARAFLHVDGWMGCFGMRPPLAVANDVGGPEAIEAWVRSLDVPTLERQARELTFAVFREAPYLAEVPVCRARCGCKSHA